VRVPMLPTDVHDLKTLAQVMSHLVVELPCETCGRANTRPREVLASH
jgi:hypothetical protein